MTADLRDVRCRWISSGEDVKADLAAQLVRCWTEVSNAGGAVGFPFLPVDEREVASAVDALRASLSVKGRQLLVALREGRLAGWLVLDLNANPLTSHWARVLRVQTTLDDRGAGVGRLLMAEVARAARDDLGLEQLHLELRSGQGLEAFYERCGWREVGRWPAALRLGPGDDRDEVLMILRLESPAG